MISTVDGGRAFLVETDDARYLDEDLNAVVEAAQKSVRRDPAVRPCPLYFWKPGRACAKGGVGVQFVKPACQGLGLLEPQDPVDDGSRRFRQAPVVGPRVVA